MLTNKFRQLMSMMDYNERMPNNASVIELDVLSGSRRSCRRDFLWNFSRLSMFCYLSERFSRPYTSLGT